jgi:hypothetical protein
MMAIAAKTALIRFGRAILWGAIATGVTYLANHLGDFHLPQAIIPIATAVLLALEKWVRETKKSTSDGDEAE